MNDFINYKFVIVDLFSLPLNHSLNLFLLKVKDFDNLIVYSPNKLDKYIEKYLTKC